MIIFKSSQIDNKMVKENAIELLTAYLIFISFIIMFFNGIIRLFVNNTHKLDTVFFCGIILFLLFFAAKQLLRQIDIKVVVIILVLAIYMLISCFTSTEQSLQGAIALDIAVSCLPVFLLASCISNYKKFLNYLLICSYFAIYSFIILWFVIEKGEVLPENDYSQSYSYLLLLPCIILFSNLFENIKVTNIITAVIGVTVLLLFGARGPVACVLAFILLKMVEKCIAQKGIQKLVIIGCVLLGFLFVYFAFYDILEVLHNIAMRFGLSLRTIMLLENHSFFEDNSRQNLVAVGINAIGENPFLGLGMGNDRIYLAGHLNIKEAMGSYPHNIVIEILMQMGLFVGTFILLLLAYVIAMALMKTSIKSSEHNLVLIFLATGLFPLMFSGSYLQWEHFYILMGLCISISTRKRRSIHANSNTND